MSVFSERIKELRVERGLTQGELAERLGIARNSIFSYETSRRVPDIDVLAKLAEFFEVTSDYLIGLEDCRTHEAADIHTHIGLNEESIAILHAAKTKLEKTHAVSDRIIFDTLDFLIQDWNSIECIYSFLLGVSPWAHSTRGYYYRLMEDVYNYEDGTWTENTASKSEHGKKLIDAMNSYLLQKALLDLRESLFAKYKNQESAHADEE